ncbi:MAG: preprotein translocase subunit SecE [Clostridiales bacterium]|nr:preprotein translocase subunit SecE [Clostridiales bacterium]
MAEVNKKPNFFVRTGRNIAKWFREMKSELKKVVWPNGKQMVNNTLIVLASILVVGIIVCVFDFLAGKGLGLLRALFH